MYKFVLVFFSSKFYFCGKYILIYFINLGRPSLKHLENTVERPRQVKKLLMEKAAILEERESHLFGKKIDHT